MAGGLEKGVPNPLVWPGQTLPGLAWQARPGQTKPILIKILEIVIPSGIPPAQAQGTMVQWIVLKERKTKKRKNRKKRSKVQRRRKRNKVVVAIATVPQKLRKRRKKSKQ